MTITDYPPEAIQAQIAYWESGQVPGSPEEAEALRWRFEASKHLREPLRQSAEHRFTWIAYHAWRKAKEKQS